MLYFTQLVFVKEGHEATFREFEDNVLPLLARHNGHLVYRVRPNATDVISTEVGNPYEVHLVSFETREDFEAYSADEERQRYVPLKDGSVASTMLIEGKLLQA